MVEYGYSFNAKNIKRRISEFMASLEDCGNDYLKIANSGVIIDASFYYIVRT